MVAVGAGVATALTKEAIEQYAQYEQLIGGVETLFKDSSDKVLQYANDAYKNTGLSANEYMDTVTSFSASLISSLGGDTAKASDIANMAIEDMSDNANKMGTDMQSIQNAYQGFAKQNYTMLDNLKLGFGGTKEEMQRLLEEAEKISGIEYDISNFSDVVEAIHVIQDQMGITGTTAKEASSTIEGSLASMKSAWTNTLTGMADSNADFDTLINNLVDSVGTFGDNILPRIEVAIQGIGKLIEELLPPIVEKIPGIITDVLPNLISAGINAVKSLIEGIVQALPQLTTSAIEIIGMLTNAFIELAPMMLEAGLQLLVTLGQGLASGLPQMIPTIVDLIVSMCDMFIENIPMFIDVAIDIILALVEGLVNALPILIQEIPRIINSFCNAIYEKLPDILKAGIEIIVMLVKGLIDSIPIIVENLPQIIMAIVNVFTMMNWASIGKNLITGIGEGIKSMASNIGSISKGVAESVTNAIKGIFTGNGAGIGRNLISFVSDGISSMLSGIVSVATNIGTSVVNVFKNMFSMSSMAEIGKNLVKGIWNGISNMTGWIIDLIGGFAGSVVSSIKSFFGIGSSSKSKSSNMASGASMYALDTYGIATASLDNVALSGSYYNSNTRSSVRANDIIRQVNGGVDSINQTTALNSIVSKFTQELNNIKSENNNSMNVIAKALESMSDAIKGLKLEAVIDGEKLTGRLNKIDGKNLNLYERWNGVS